VGKVSPERLLKLLQHEDPAKRRKAVEALGGWGPTKSLAHLLEVRRTDSSPDVRAVAAALLRKVGATIDLAPMGADQWFEQVKESSPAFETLCDVMGERFVGYALIVGVQISGLTIDQFTPANTLVEFKLVEANPPRTLRLPEFRRELVNWILADAPTADSAVLPLDLAQAQQLIGVRFILLAPLHGLSLREVILDSPGRAPRATVVLSRDGAEPEDLNVVDLRAELLAAVRAELAAARDEPFELDFKLVDAAEAAAKEGRWEDVLALIGHWPGPLSMLSRMQMAATLDATKKGRIGTALACLARAYRSTGRTAWAEELHRLGLQFAGDSPAGSQLYLALGEAMVEERRFGESVGPLRRALSLGAPIAKVGPLLGLALLRCRRTVAAAVVLERAIRDGADRSDVLPTLRATYRELGGASNLLRSLHDGWVSEADITESPTPRMTLTSSLVDEAESTLEVALGKSDVDATSPVAADAKCPAGASGPDTTATGEHEAADEKDDA
jgi:hypothetical protein